MRLRLSSLAVLLGLTLSVTAVVGVVATYIEAGDELHDVLDDDLASQGRLLARLLETERDRLPDARLDALLRKAFRPDEEDTLWVNVYDTTTGHLASNLQHELPLRDPHGDDIRLQLDGHDWLGYQHREGHLVVQLLRRADRYDDVRADILEDITTPVLLGSAVNLALLAALIVLSLWPLARLVRALEARSPDSLAPLTVPTPAVEIGILRDTLNALMADVDAMLKRERQFASDIAHELRTPLTTLKLELADPDPDRLVLKAEVERLARLVEQLLILARIEQERWRSVFVAVDLQALCEREIGHLAGRMQDAGMQIEQDLAPAVVDGEPTLLQTLARNLLNNVIDHCPAGTQVLVRLGSIEGCTVLEVSDSGPGIPEEFRRQMDAGFTRFDSRSAGLGIGLTICQRIAQVHGATLRFLANDDGTPGLKVRLSWP